MHEPFLLIFATARSPQLGPWFDEICSVFGPLHLKADILLMVQPGTVSTGKQTTHPYPHPRTIWFPPLSDTLKQTTHHHTTNTTAPRTTNTPLFISSPTHTHRSTHTHTHARTPHLPPPACSRDTRTAPTTLPCQPSSRT